MKSKKKPKKNLFPLSDFIKAAINKSKTGKNLAKKRAIVGKKITDTKKKVAKKITDTKKKVAKKIYK